jgi:hypothetical protein
MIQSVICAKSLSFTKRIALSCTIYIYKVMYFIRKIDIMSQVFLALAFLFLPLSVMGQERKSWQAPLDIPLFLSGNYGEIRTDHFHAGLDLKTQQTEGKQVLAADSGMVVRISVASGGYGRAVYLKHPDGSMTVYGHLQRFEPGLQNWVTERQYREKSFAVNLIPPAGRFLYAKGECIGYSGNTGSSGGPHLHFEIRDKSGEIALNGLFCGFAIKDSIPPVIRRIGIFPLDPSAVVNGCSAKEILAVTDSFGTTGAVATVHGRIGFGIETYDYLNGSPNVCSPYTVSLYVDDRLHFRFRLDSIPFALTGYMNSHIDFAEQVMHGHAVQKLFLDPGNRLHIYPVQVDRGTVVFTDSLLHHVQVVSADAYGNTATQAFSVRSVPQAPEVSAAEPESDSLVRLDWQRPNTVSKGNLRLQVPEGALYDNCALRIRIRETDSLTLSPLYTVGSETIPLHRAASLSLRADHIPKSLRGKVYLAGLTYRGKRLAFGGRYKDGMITAAIPVLGRFYLLADTTPPSILPVPEMACDTCGAGQSIGFRITDSGSGISRFTGKIDNAWALFVYDGKNDLLSYTVDESRLDSGKKHLFEITVWDDRGNSSRYRGSFFF